MDWNNDGKDDLISGNVYGHVYYYKRTGNGISDLITVGTLSMANGDSIDVGLRSTPFATDWNNDGKFDLVIGSQTRPVLLYLNTGTSSNPSFDSEIKLKNGDAFLKHNNSCPFVYDLNNDGKKDIIVSCWVQQEYVHVYYYENKGTDANPVFDGYEEILNPSGTAIFGKTGGYINIWLADWNGDKVIDIISSNNNGKVYVCYAINTAISEETSDTAISALKIFAAVNPARNNFPVRLVNSEEHADITVYDSSGRIAGAITISDGSELVVMQADGLPAGVYTVVASNGSSVSSCRIVLVE